MAQGRRIRRSILVVTLAAVAPVAGVTPARATALRSDAELPVSVEVLENRPRIVRYQLPPESTFAGSARAVYESMAEAHAALAADRESIAAPIVFRLQVEADNVWTIQTSVVVSSSTTFEEFKGSTLNGLRDVVDGLADGLARERPGQGGDLPPEAARVLERQAADEASLREYAEALNAEELGRLKVSEYGIPVKLVARIGQAKDEPTGDEPEGEDAEPGAEPVVSEGASTDFHPSGDVNIWLDDQKACSLEHPISWYTNCRNYLSTFEWSSARLASLNAVRSNLTYEHEMRWCDNSASLFENYSTNGFSGNEGWATNLDSGYLDTPASQYPCSGGTALDITVGSSDAHQLLANKNYYAWFILAVAPPPFSSTTELIGMNAQHGHRTPISCHNEWCVFSNDSSYGPNNKGMVQLYTLQVPGYAQWK